MNQSMSRAELLEQITQFKKIAAKIIEGDNEHHIPMLHVLKPNDALDSFGFAQGIDHKSRRVVRALAESAAVLGARGLFFISEVWFTVSTSEEYPAVEKLAKERKLHTLPNKREALLICGASMDGGVVSLAWEIVNRKISEKPTLNTEAVGMNMYNFFFGRLPWHPPQTPQETKK